MSDHDIETSRLVLVCCDRETVEAFFKGDEALAALLQVNVPAKWTEFGEPAFRYMQDKLSQPGARREWWGYLPVLKKTRTLLGTCGYKGYPREGMVEIGYEVAEAYRGLGLATEMAQALIANAFKYQEVDCVQAHTLAVENESGSVLRKCGMQRMEELEDPEDGKIWRWEIRRQTD